ncbi:hypothetical protein [Flavobacteriaceae bacterium 14752]|uniref:hypothetical protein n=1 Tax=Mesohalobacter salilacus TaxID=2491711 RepID=UPI000F632552|nr:hypothetical protein EIG84_04840 [Flavobacteriaceae bacterium 14752]
MKKIKAITASLIMLVGILTLAFSSQDVEAKQSNSSDWRVMANNGKCYNDPYDCQPEPVIIIGDSFTIAD